MIRIASILCLAALASPVMAQQKPAASTAEDARRLSDLFRQVDLDRNGRLTKVEMSAFGARHHLGVLVNNRTWKRFDTGRDGTLTRREFIDGMVADRAAGRRR